MNLFKMKECIVKVVTAVQLGQVNPKLEHTSVSLKRNYALCMRIFEVGVAEYCAVGMTKR